MNNLHWLAGYLEGEGCFYYGGSRKYPTLRITVESTDLDVISRVASMFNRAICGPKKHNPGQDTYYTAIAGAPSAGWMMTLYPMLSTRRKSKIR